jgi:hypothetical protein
MKFGMFFVSVCTAQVLKLKLILYVCGDSLDIFFAGLGASFQHHVQCCAGAKSLYRKYS